MKIEPMPVNGLFDKRYFRLYEDFKINIIYDNDKIAVIIPKGFVFNGASVPRLLRYFTQSVGILLEYSLVHNYMYEYGLLKLENKKVLPISTRKLADQIFRDSIEKTIGKFTVNIIYYGIRILGSGRFEH